MEVKLLNLAENIYLVLLLHPAEVKTLWRLGNHSVSNK